MPMQWRKIFVVLVFNVHEGRGKRDILTVSVKSKRRESVTPLYLLWRECVPLKPTTSIIKSWLLINAPKATKIERRVCLSIP